MGYAHPPIPAGRTIVPSEAHGLLYPVYKKDQSLEGWYFFAGDCFKGNFSPIMEPQKLSEGDINFASQLSKASLSKGNKECFRFLDDKYIYTITDNYASHVVKTPRHDKFVGKDAFFAICPHINSHILNPDENGADDFSIIDPVVMPRSFYCGCLKNGKKIILYDFHDDTYEAELPFTTSNGGQLEVSLLSQIVSYKSTYLVFVTTETCGADKYNVSFYAITEKDLAEKSDNLTLKDFSILHLGAGDQYPIHAVSDQFYYDDQNTGSMQFLVCFNDYHGHTISLKMFEINETDQIINTVSHSIACSSGDAASTLGLVPLKQRKSLLAYAMVTSGPVIFISFPVLHMDTKYSAMDTTPNLDNAHKNIGVTGVVNVMFFTFDAKDKTFVERDKAFITLVPAVRESLKDDSESRDANVLTKSADQAVAFSPYTAVMPQAEMQIDDKTKEISSILKGVDVVYTHIEALVSQIPSVHTPKAFLPFIHTRGHNLSSDTTYIDIDNMKFMPYIHTPESSNTFLEPENVEIPAGLQMHDIPRSAWGTVIIEACNFEGNSIVLDVPKLSFTSSIPQVTGFYRALPFEKTKVQTPPMLNVSSTDSKINGITESTSSNWSLGYNASGTATDEGVTASAHFGQSFGEHNMNMKSDTKGITLHAMEDLSSYDMLTGYGSDFYLWEYPISRYNGGGESSAVLSVFVPIGYTQQFLDAKESRLGYYQDYEIGSLLTYVNSQLPGYSEEKLLFKPSTITVTSDSQGGMSVIYDQSNSTYKEKSKTTDTSINAGASVNFFGVFSLGTNYHKTTSHTKSIHTMQTKDFSVMFHAGTVEDAQYEYKITPLVYRHKDTNVLVTTCRVELESLGEGWKQHFSKYDVRLMRSFPNTENKELQAFTSNIRFAKQVDKTVGADT